jgi:hypothetical protein
VEPDGKILVALRGPSSSVVERVVPHGGLDDTFGSGGVAPLDITAIDGIVIDTEGRIVVCGISGGDVGVQRLVA